MDDETLALAATRPDAYIRTRARAEGGRYELTADVFTVGLREDVRKLFGVTVGDDGRMESDEQQPRHDFFADYCLEHQRR
jgi:hypothetical protein